MRRFSIFETIMIRITQKNTEPTKKNTRANFDSELIATYNHNTKAFAHII